ncbi:hypothetical protein D3C78_1625530 [compost metagenome]
MADLRSTLRTSVPELLAVAPKFSTLMVRSAVYSSVSASWPSPRPTPARVNSLVPPMTPSTVKGLPVPSMGTARIFTDEPPSSKLDWKISTPL